MNREIEAVVDRVSKYAVSRDYRGFDPYDALNSPVVRALSFGSKYGRIAWTQLLRRFPINLRHLLLTPRGHNPKGLGLFLWGFAKLTQSGRSYDAEIARLLRLIADVRSPNCTGNGWGYNFDWQSRVFFVPKQTPTIVNTAFVGHALIDTWLATGEQSALDLAVPSADFILNDLNRIREGDTFCFSYTPIDELAVHNANLMGASLLVRLHEHTGDNRLLDAALESAAYSIKYQHDDGSWFYAEPKTTQYIDSFHTGFNLQALRYFLDAGHIPEYRAQYEQGVRFYAERFFLDDGTPRFFHDRTYPIDIHSPAQAIVFFSGAGAEYSDLTDRVLDWMLDNLYDPRGYFYFRKARLFTNRIPYMRWSQSWGFHALTEYWMRRHAKRS